MPRLVRHDDSNVERVAESERVRMSYELDRYRPKASWFHDPHGIHGVAHAARVLVLANAIVDALSKDGVQVDTEVVRWAAVLHDVGRVDDGKDPEHGQRSADWLLDNPAVASTLSDPQREVAASAIRWHVPWDNEVPAEAHTPEWVCLKDADALDRLRIGDLDPRLLRTEAAQELVVYAGRLVGETCVICAPLDAWEQVRRAALVMRLWK
jgi:HD superfamily phosphodiesterase